MKYCNRSGRLPGLKNSICISRGILSLDIRVVPVVGPGCLENQRGQDSVPAPFFCFCPCLRVSTGRPSPGSIQKAFLLLIVIFIVLAFHPAWAQAAGDPNLPAATKEYDRALLLIKEGKNQEALPFLERAIAVMPENRNLQADYVLCLVWTENYRRAADYYLAHEKGLQSIRYVPRHVAKAFYELRDFSKSRDLYRAAWSYDRKDEEAFKAIKEGVKEKGTDKLVMKPVEGLTDEEIKALVKQVRKFKK